MGSGVILLDVLRDVSAKRRQLPACITKSALLRNVSVLVSSLEMVSNPSESNHAFCARAAKMLSDKLDRALDPELPNGKDSFGSIQPIGTGVDSGNIELGSLFNGGSAFMFAEHAAVADQSWTNWGLLDPEMYPTILP